MGALFSYITGFFAALTVMVCIGALAMVITKEPLTAILVFMFATFLCYLFTRKLERASKRKDKRQAWLSYLKADQERERLREEVRREVEAEYSSSLD